MFPCEKYPVVSHLQMMKHSREAIDGGGEYNITYCITCFWTLQLQWQSWTATLSSTDVKSNVIQYNSSAMNSTFYKNKCSVLVDI